MYRHEHPRPDALRDLWLNLNGTWQFEIDDNRTGIAKHFENRDDFSMKIEVPFCPESRLSGVAHTDYMNAVWYRRTFTLPASFTGKRVLLHIGACDDKTTAFVNGKTVGSHVGGYTPMTFDITDALTDGENAVVVYAEDDVRSTAGCRGKQSQAFASRGCCYTRTTGIWQTVWLEAVDAARVLSYKVYPNISAPSVGLSVRLTGAALGKTLRADVLFGGRPVGTASVAVGSEETVLSVSLTEKHLWSVGDGQLYDLVFTLSDGGCVTDTLRGYFGLREVGFDVRGLLLNGKHIFQRLVLDQGFYPDGIYTAPTADDLRRDIEYAMALGFNGARLHQKVFEPLFLYYADRLGYLVWDETGNWGLDHTDPMNIYNFLPQWIEEMERDFSHPSLIGWCPFNETWDKYGRTQSEELLNMTYDVTKAIDPTRPCVGSSGSYPAKGDFHDVHDYTQEPDVFRDILAGAKDGLIKDQLWRKDPKRQKMDTSRPVFISEYGGIKWTAAEDGSAWGYGKSVENEEEFLSRLDGLTSALLDNARISAFCYTQLTDVEQEQNGLMTYDRRFKFDPEKIRRIMTKPAAMEDGAD